MHSIQPLRCLTWHLPQHLLFPEDSYIFFILFFFGRSVELTGWLLFFFLGSLLSFLISIPEIDHIISDVLNRETNKTWNFKVCEEQTIIYLVLMNTEIIIPITISIASFIWLLLSLWRHSKRMRFYIIVSQDPSAEAHVKAMRMVTSFLSLFLIYIISIHIVVYGHILSASPADIEV